MLFQRRRNREGNGGARPAMLKPRGRKYLFAPAIICRVYQLLDSQNFYSVHLKSLCVVHLYIVLQCARAAKAIFLFLYLFKLLKLCIEYCSLIFSGRGVRLSA